jgi:hypothetical protein
MDFLGLLLSFTLLVLIRKSLTQSLFSVLQQITRNPRAEAIIYALLFFPGVVLHELSHWVAAKLLRVPTHRFSLIPEWISPTRLRFGYVEMRKTDSLRSALIGLAPLLTGSAVILWLAINPLNLKELFEGGVRLNSDALIPAVSTLLSTEDLWGWFYLLFAISNSMLPSPSDRQSLFPAVMILLGIALMVYLLGLAPQARVWFEEPVQILISAMTSAFLIAVFFDVILAPPIWLADRILRRLRR